MGAQAGIKTGDRRGNKNVVEVVATAMRGAEKSSAQFIVILDFKKLVFLADEGLNVEQSVFGKIKSPEGIYGRIQIQNCHKKLAKMSSHDVCSLVF